MVRASISVMDSETEKTLRKHLASLTDAELVVEHARAARRWRLDRTYNARNLLIMCQGAIHKRGLAS